MMVSISDTVRYVNTSSYENSGINIRRLKHILYHSTLNSKILVRWVPRYLKDSKKEWKYPGSGDMPAWLPSFSAPIILSCLPGTFKVFPEN